MRNTETRGSLTVKRMKASTAGYAGSWTVFCVGGRPSCGEEALPGKYCIDDNLPKEGTRIFKFLKLGCDFSHSKQIFTSGPNVVFITLYSFK